MRLDDISIGGDERGGRLNEIGPERPLGQEDVLCREPSLAHHGLRDAHEGVADDLALELRPTLPLERQRGLAIDLGDGLGKVIGGVECFDG
eukprot:scaffold101737_cov29-Tisochrysis_lutea.AAC.3